jgi:hypothetical protein
VTRPTSAGVADAMARLSELTIIELRQEWRRYMRMPPPVRLSRDLLLRGIRYKIQERAHGGLSKMLLRRLRDAASGPAHAPGGAPPSSFVLKLGTKLIRDWHGDAHTVLVVEGGFEWQGTQYRSLTTIAREITGAHWSGPRFFGLRARSASKTTGKRHVNEQD